ncbi:helix-turn-helix domain-containing protein [Homoserinibacter sp. GY 40078]|uniref:helix-turn-helix domain-containing protein n=1 Tax=Homoserinibacter sp. GY 40078 TaxID=2603275 RepID=UPI0011C9D926|nr:helix-turn-helix transcriptional regulator [Homoserinibacter sp. GY 40078]TXK17188.1 helix-turn-helix transcriptional regulator [Homoserinibacter sp. GY 40078]
MATYSSWISQAIAQLVIALLGETGLTRRALATSSGITYSTLLRKLDGQGEFSVQELYLIAKVFGIPPSELLPRAFQRVAA